MNDNQDKAGSDQWKDIERELRQGREFTLADAIGRLAGPGAMKGVSPVARRQQCEAEIEYWLRDHLSDSDGALRTVLLQAVKRSELLLNNYDQPPLVVLAAYCQRVLNSQPVLKELVREADSEWGRAYGERPHFDRDGQAPHADDPYTIESVRKRLADVIEQLVQGKN
jgi:hypothetical protein